MKLTVELTIDHVANELMRHVYEMKDPTPTDLVPPFNYAIALFSLVATRMLAAHNDAPTTENLQQVMHAAINNVTINKETLQ